MDTESVIISLARDFSATPGARRRAQGRFSGEEFRDELILPAIKKGNVIVDLDRALGLPPSFLDEAFGVLLQAHPEFATRLHIELTDNLTAKQVLKECIEVRLNSAVARSVFGETLSQN